MGTATALARMLTLEKIPMELANWIGGLTDSRILVLLAMNIFLLIVGEVWHLLSGRRLDPKYEAWIHGAGFALLLLLMVVVTFSDIWKLVT